MMVLLAILVVFLFFFVRVAYETVTCYWVIPRRIRRIMEKQGVCGPKPRFLTGNILDMASLVSKSTSKDMDSIHHDIVGRLLPHFLVWSKLYGNPFFGVSLVSFLFSFTCSSSAKRSSCFHRKLLELVFPKIFSKTHNFLPKI